MKVSIKKYIFSSGGFVIIFGIVFFIIMLSTNLSKFSDAMLRFEVPSTQTLDLMPGTYTIYHEYKTFFKNIHYDQKGMNLEHLNLELLDSSSTNIPLDYSNTYSRYSFKHRTGYSIANFSIENQGIYTFNASFDDNSNTKIICSIGRGVFENLFKTITTSVFVLITCFVAGFAMIRRKIYKTKKY
ncbi:MAG: hypothetical protein N4A40_14500 [Tissierellales bacterium]|jgi:ABC-type glycerol-3-phosphate transport system permease component|nr:hypothetical protein [Tissierellales bacterium]